MVIDYNSKHISQSMNITLTTVSSIEKIINISDHLNSFAITGNHTQSGNVKVEIIRNGLSPLVVYSYKSPNDNLLTGNVIGEKDTLVEDEFIAVMDKEEVVNNEAVEKKQESYFK